VKLYRKPSRCRREVAIKKPTWLQNRLLVLALCGAAAANGSPSQPQKTRVSSKGSEGFRVIRAIPLVPATSARGEFSILIPSDWTITEVPGAPLAAIISSPGQKSTAIYLVLLATSDIRYQTMLNRCTQQYTRNPLFAPNLISSCVAPAVRAQLADSSYQWNSAQALQAILQMFSGPSATFQATSSKDISAGLLEYCLSSMEDGRPLQHWGDVSMSYLPNPLLSQAGRTGVTSLALITGCRASPEQQSEFRSMCAAVLRSFRPVPGWGQSVAQQFIQVYQQEAQALLRMGTSVAANMGVTRNMIGNFGASMQRMQTQTYEQIQQANHRTQQNWIATLGENVNMQDPVTGKVYTLPEGFKNYCLDGTGSEVLMGQDVTLGRSVSKSGQCARMLHPW
jgi:hypothetical protein